MARARQSTSTNQVLRVAPANIGPRSNPVYNPTKGVTNLGGNRLAFAGPRDDPFFVDLGSIFDLGGLRPFNPFHAIQPPTEPGPDGVLNYNVHTIALQVPKTDLVQAPNADGTIGIYAERAAGRDARLERQRNGSTPGRVGAGLTARESADQRGRHPDRAEGLLERLRPQG